MISFNINFNLAFIYFPVNTRAANSPYLDSVVENTAVFVGRAGRDDLEVFTARSLGYSGTADHVILVYTYKALLYNTNMIQRDSLTNLDTFHISK